jgi:dTDP-4-dehydrorhamnose reductase
MTKLIGVTGYSGHVGQELLQFPNVVPLAGDVRKKDEITRAVRNTQVDVIIHLASISEVDKCEKPENQYLVDSTNVRGTFHVAEVAEECGCQMVLLSTSHIFDGKWGNYKENSRPNPLNYYGFSKLAAEGFREIFPSLKVVRTSYLFDFERVFRHVYPLRAGQSYEYPTFIERSFMYLPHFADAFYQYILRIDEMPKILNIGGSQSVSWYQFIFDMAQVYGLDTDLVCSRDHEISIDNAPRPHKAGLNISASNKLGLPQYGYKEGLLEMKRASE